MPTMIGGGVISSPGIRSGRILISEDQYSRYSDSTKALFERIYTGRSFMYRYKDATEPFVPQPMIVPEKTGDALDDTWSYAITIHNTFLEVLSQPSNAMGVLIEGDEDEEFTYHIFVTVLNLLSFKETDWMLQHEFGNLYSVHSIDMLLTT